MKFKGTLIGEASGSLASMVFSHNRGGQYIRQRTIPTNPNSAYQQAIRSLVSLLTAAWNNILTQDQRDLWDCYAEQVPLLDPLGEARNVGGLGMYIRGNVARLQTGETTLTRVDDAPTIYNLGEYTPPAITSITATTKVMIMTFTTADEWANEDGSVMIVYGSRGQNPTKNFFKGPYRQCGVILGDSGTPPTSPVNITLPFPLAAGQKAFIRVVVNRADGRTSSPFRDGKICV